jgi:hypothetical protein
MTRSRSHQRLIQAFNGFLDGEAVEDPAHYAVPSAGVIWGSFSKEISD